MSRQSTKNRNASSDSTVDSVEQRVVELAEQVGRIVGTVQAKTEGWFDRQALSDQFASVRDSAADLMKHLAAVPSKLTRAKPAETTPRARGRSGGVVDAPGKKHRKAMPSAPGTKHSDTRIAKMKLANETRRRGPTRQQ